VGLDVVKAINKKKDSFNLGIPKSTHHPTNKKPRSAHYYTPTVSTTGQIPTIKF